MSKKRMVDTKFWSDPYVLELKPLEKLFYLYLFTNQHTNISGIYEVATKTIEHETGFSRQQIDALSRKFTKDGKVFFVNNWIMVVNFLRHQKKNPSILKGIINETLKVPEEIISRMVSVDAVFRHSVHRVGTDCIQSVYTLRQDVSNYIIFKKKINKKELEKLDIDEISVIQKIGTSSYKNKKNEQTEHVKIESEKFVSLSEILKNNFQENVENDPNLQKESENLSAGDKTTKSKKGKWNIKRK